MTTRLPTPQRATPAFSYCMDIATEKESGETFVYALVKYTWAFGPRGLEARAPLELLHDFRDESLSPRLVAGTDFWPNKARTDLAVLGSAFAPSGRPVSRLTAAVELAGRRKSIAVFGSRAVTWGSVGGPKIGTAEPFEAMPLGWEHAYGGIDWRVDVPGRDDVEVASRLLVDHPGMYARNPFGMGFLVEEGAVPDMFMPNLEDPEDLLTADRLVLGDPARWFEQPRPATFSWVNPAVFPRHVFFAADVEPWFPPPTDDSLPEIASGDLPASYRDEMGGRSVEQGADPRFKQAASSGLCFDEALEGQRVKLENLHPARPEIAFDLPPARPRMEFSQEGSAEEAEVRLHSVLVEPSEERVSLLYAASQPLRRPFIVGVHKHIPIQLRVDGAESLEFEAPVPILERIRTAQEEMK